MPSLGQHPPKDCLPLRTVCLHHTPFSYSRLARTAEEESRILEEQWISSFSSGSTFEPPPPHYPRDTAVRATTQGLLIGFFAPVLSIFLGNEDLKPPIFFDGTVFPELGNSEVEALPSVVVPPVMSQAILAGLVLNFLGALIFFLYT